MAAGPSCTVPPLAAVAEEAAAAPPPSTCGAGGALGVVPHLTWAAASRCIAFHDGRPAALAALARAMKAARARGLRLRNFLAKATVSMRKPPATHSRARSVYFLRTKAVRCSLQPCPLRERAQESRTARKRLVVGRRGCNSRRAPTADEPVAEGSHGQAQATAGGRRGAR